jgi:hypothetical protein
MAACATGLQIPQQAVSLLRIGRHRLPDFTSYSLSPLFCLPFIFLKPGLGDY